MATIAMPHIGMGGHLGPAARLGAVLVRQGHRVIAWAPERYRGYIEPTGAEFRSHDPIAAGSLTLPGLSAEMAEATERCAEALINELHEAGVDLVIHDLHVPWARVAGDFLGLPRLVSNPLFPGHDPASSGRLDAIPAPAAAEEIKRAHARVEASRLAIAGRWGVDIGEWSTALSSTADVTVSYSTPEVTGLPEPGPGWHYVGPLMDAVPPGRARDDPEQPPLVYLAFGTAPNINPDAFRVAIEALTGEPVRVVVSTGGRRISPNSLPPLPKTVVLREFVDPPRLLAEAALHVTHAGASSVHASLLAGVPMVCVPQSSDQFHWAQRVEALGVGWVVELRSRAIRTATRALLDDRSARSRASELGRHLAGYDGESRVAELVKGALQS